MRYFSNWLVLFRVSIVYVNKILLWVCFNSFINSTV